MKRECVILTDKSKGRVNIQQFTAGEKTVHIYRVLMPQNNHLQAYITQPFAQNKP